MEKNLKWNFVFSLAIRNRGERATFALGTTESKAVFGRAKKRKIKSC